MQSVEQKWYCFACQTEGSIEISPKTDPLVFIEMLRKEHLRASPSCLHGVAMMRVRPVFMSEQEWEEQKRGQGYAA